MIFSIPLRSFLSFPALVSALLASSQKADATSSVVKFVDPHPLPGNDFGASVVRLSTGNVVVTAPRSSFNGTLAGSVYLFNGVTGELISELHGSSYDDRIGSEGVTEVGDGNFVIRSQHWDNGSVGNAGAVTWGSGTTGVSGVVSASNSLVGSSTFGGVASGGLIVLANGNYLVRSSVGGSYPGAVTWGSGAIGVSGVVGPAISLVGTRSGDGVGTVTALANGDYVVASPSWNDGLLTDVGAVTLCRGTTGLAGVISSANSLIGSSAGDRVGTDVVDLPNGHFVVLSPDWDRGSMADAGAVTWVHGGDGLTGAITTDNSLVGRAAGDRVGTSAAVLGNGHYVVGSTGFDNGGVSNVGAATWVNGSGRITGMVTPANSLIGSSANDRVGNKIIALKNGNYVVSSEYWSNAGAASAGAATWCSGASATSGVVGPANSLVGSSANDQVGFGVVPLTNGNYVVSSRYWSNAGLSGAGAVTWCSGTAATGAVVGPSNSLVGSRANDRVGSVTSLKNGNYVVESENWDNGSIVDAGAVTWGSGSTGISGVVSAANSLVGTSAGDKAGFRGISLLPNGNYIVATKSWDNGAVADAGAVTWCNGVTGTSGPISSSNSLVGSSAGETLGERTRVLSNGNYVVASSRWSSGDVASAGAVTWADGATGVSGVITPANSLVGTSASDAVGNGLTIFPNGNYVVHSSTWDHGSLADIGAVTWCDGLVGRTGPVTAANSMIGETPQAGLRSIITDEANETFYAVFVNGGTITMVSGSQSEDLAPRPLVIVTEGASTLTDGGIAPVDFGEVAVGAEGTKTFTISNPGSADLVISGIGKDGAHASEFSVGEPVAMTVLPGASTTFTVTFIPLASGVRTAAIHLFTNSGSPGESFDVALAGDGIGAAGGESGYADWVKGTDLSGVEAEAAATPFGDGVANLLKYAFNMDASGPDVRTLTADGIAGLPLVELDASGAEPVLRVTYLRRIGSGLVYTAQTSDTLENFVGMTETPVITPINSEWERVTVEQAASHGAKFARVEVREP